MASQFYFAILEKGTDKVIAGLEPGDTKDLVAAFMQRFSETSVTQFLDSLESKGVGWFRGTEHVKSDADAALKEVVLKAAQAALESIIYELKAQVKRTAA